jgi:hypothetical protein
MPPVRAYLSLSCADTFLKQHKAFSIITKLICALNPTICLEAFCGNVHSNIMFRFNFVSKSCHVLMKKAKAMVYDCLKDNKYISAFRLYLPFMYRF